MWADAAASTPADPRLLVAKGTDPSIKSAVLFMRMMFAQASAPAPATKPKKATRRAAPTFDLPFALRHATA